MAQANATATQERPTFPSTSRKYGPLTLTADDLGTHYTLTVQVGSDAYTALNYQTADYGNLQTRIAFIADRALEGVPAEDIAALIGRQNIRDEFEAARRRRDWKRLNQLAAADEQLMAPYERALAVDVRNHLAEQAGVNDEARRESRDSLRRDVQAILGNSSYSPYRGFRKGGAR